MTNLISFSLPYREREQNIKGNTKSLHRGVLKTGVPQEEIYLRCLWEVLNYRAKERKMSPQGCKKHNVCNVALVSMNMTIKCLLYLGVFNGMEILKCKIQFNG